MKIRVRVDSNVGAFTTRALLDLAQLPLDAFTIAVRAAAEELATKTYQDRTRDLRNATRATMPSGGDDWVIHLDMGNASTLYGVFVQARGFSNFDQIAVGAGMDIDAMIRRSVAGSGRG